LEELVETERLTKERIEKDRKALETRVGELEAACRNLESDKVSSGEAFKNLKLQLEDTTRKLEEAESAAARLKAEKKTLGDEISDLEALLEQEVENGRKDKRRMTAKVQELQDKVNNAPKGDANAEDLKKLEDQLKEVVEDLAGADKARSASERLASQAGIELEDLKTQLEDLGRALGRGAGMDKRQEADKLEVKEAFEAAQTARVGLEETGKRLAAEAEELRKRLSDLAMGAAAGADTFDYKRENRALKKEVGDLDRENRGYERELRSLKDKIAEATYVLEQERAAKEKLAEEAKELKVSFVDSEKLSGEAVGKIQAVNEEDIASLLAEMSELEEKNKLLQGQLMSSPAMEEAED